MRLFDRILETAGFAPVSRLASLQTELDRIKAEQSKAIPAMLLAQADSQRWDMPEATVAEKQAKLYATLTWIATAIDRTAEIASAAEFSVRKLADGPDGEDKDIPNHAFELRLLRPNPAQSKGEFLRDAFSWYKTTGNLYIHKNAANENAEPDELWIVPSHMMKPLPDGQSYIRGYEFTAPGKKPIFIPPWQIMHLHTFNPFNLFVGLSAIQSLALDSAGDIAQQKWNAKLFDKDNGKLPVILAFKHMIADPIWKDIKRQRDEEWGGSNRPGVMLLRGIEDTMQVLQAGASQKEMEFLEGRNFTKEEIYSKLAPGLASILAVNATEANAIAGKSTLIEFGVWPMLEQLAQKITADILPVYGDALVGTFDDIRQTNRILDLQEQQEYAKYHTINEVRAEYYSEDPLYLDPSQITALEDKAQAAEERQTMALQTLNANGAKAHEQPLDPRGLMFVAQIGPSTPLPGDPTKQPPPPALQQPPQMQTEGDTAGEQAPSGEEVAAEMKAWERFAVKRLGKGGRDFEPRVLPLMQAARIKTALKSTQTEADVRRIFDGEREPSGAEILAALNRAAAAAERLAQ